MRRQALEEELQRTKPPADPDLDRAQALVEDFARFWQAEPDPAERRKLLAALFEQIWQKDGTIVAVKPHGAFARYFAAATEAATAKTPKGHSEKRGDKGGSDGGRSLTLPPDDIEVWRTPPWEERP